MWILPNNQIISVPQNVVINDIQHPQTIFYGWSKEQLLGIGIRAYHLGNAPEGYRVTAARTEVVDDEVYEIFDLEQVQEPEPEPEPIEEPTQELTEEPSTTTP
jgi:hypothetical protein